MYRTPIVTGDRVAIAPHHDLWMAGCRFGLLIERKHGIYNVRLDTGREVWLSPDDLLGAVAGTPVGGATRSTENEYGFVCAEFDEDGSCIHSDHMSKAGL